MTHEPIEGYAHIGYGYVPKAMSTQQKIERVARALYDAGMGNWQREWPHEDFITCAKAAIAAYEATKREAVSEEELRKMFAASEYNICSYDVISALKAAGFNIVKGGE